ncbi:MAG: glycoside hydrolase family 3 C-terminal domain-containing protein [Lachnospiraceae bacterium]|nr:glycoside hydrolase family 3 C-terminal domain-containing protein [Lachnospiraceae bacterium]
MTTLKLSPEEILTQMTLEEKAALVNGASFFGMAGLDRFDIPALQLLDGGTGMNFEQLFGDMYSRSEKETNSTNGMVGSTVLTHVIDWYYEPEKLTEEELEVRSWIEAQLRAHTGRDYAPGCFPPGILLGATFNPDVVKTVGEALGAEARLFGVHILLGSPNVNIHRDPLNGRLFEGYSEDPCLVSTLAPELVKGVQKFKVAANVKHFAANNQETNRVGINETISERALQEIYYPGFKACVQEGKVETVMSAYNRINGIPCTESYKLLTEELRGKWGFEGTVLSDWGAVYHPVEALQAGNDLAMPGPLPAEPIIEAVKGGRLSMDILDQAVLRLLKTIAYCLENPYKNVSSVSIGEKEIPMWAVNSCGDGAPDLDVMYEATTAAAYESAAEGIVLLKNEGVYPLSSEERILLTGSHEFLTCGTGSAGITTNRNTSFTDCIGGTYVGYDYDFEDLCKENKGLHVILTATVSGMEGNDRPHMKISDADDMLLRKLITLKQNNCFSLTLVLNVCGPVDLRDYEACLDAIWCVFLPGMEGARALADLMLGKRTPSGKLPITFPKRYEDTPTFLNFPGEGYEVNYGEGIYIGYRYYDKKKVAPAYPFGYGLSYTTFKIDHCKADKKEFDGDLKISLTVTNTGKLPGAEVVQVYISDETSMLPKPVKELKKFRKVFLQPGESKDITFELFLKDFMSFDMDYNEWLAEEGYYHILIATSSAEADIKGDIRVYLDIRSPYSYGFTSTVKTIFEKEALKEALFMLWKENDWDMQIIASNYQYTPNRTIEQIMPAAPSESSRQAFLAKVEKVRH